MSQSLSELAEERNLLPHSEIQHDSSAGRHVFNTLTELQRTYRGLCFPRKYHKIDTF